MKFYICWVAVSLLLCILAEIVCRVTGISSVGAGYLAGVIAVCIMGEPD